VFTLNAGMLKNKTLESLFAYSFDDSKSVMKNIVHENVNLENLRNKIKGMLVTKIVSIHQGNLNHFASLWDNDVQTFWRGPIFTAWCLVLIGIRRESKK